MTLDDILNEWAEDSKIDIEELHAESIRTPQLHSKYMTFLVNARVRTMKFEREYKDLRMQKKIFFMQGHNNETMEHRWVMPAKGKLTNAEVVEYLDVDEHIVNAALKISLQKEKTDLLIEIIKSINKRSFEIKNAIEFIRFKHGLS